MPFLKDLTCTIELSRAHQPLTEYNTIYGDGVVETCVSIPTQPQSFSIHLTSTKFIAPGIALFVYIDGVYQCNRNRQGLKPGMPSDRHSLVDFRVRQKEERRRDGSMVAREWTFDTLSTMSAGESCVPNTLENKDCIEVVVLRCAGTRDTKAVSTMNLDGAGDWSDCYLDSDAGSSKDRKWSGHDNRGPKFNRVGGKFSSTTTMMPSPPLSYRAPYVETLRSDEDSDYKIHYERDRSTRASNSRHSMHGSRHSGTISPRTRRADDLPPEGFQYGSGPIPSGKEGSHHKKHSNTGLKTNGVDPVWLNKLLKTAVKQGVEESRRAGARSGKHDRDSTCTSEKEDLTSQAPGAWPGSPISKSKKGSGKSKRVPSHRSEHRSDCGSDWGRSQDAWTQHETKSKVGIHVNWDVKPAWETETSSGDSDWRSNDGTPSESWNTDETWETTRADEWKDPRASAKLCPSTAPPYFNSRLLVRPEPSKPGYGSQSEAKGWVNHASSSSSVSLSSSNNTIQPPHYQDHVQVPRRRSKASIHPPKSPHIHTRNLSHHTSSWHPSEVSKPSASSSITHVTPVIVNAPVTPVSKHSRSKKPSTHADAQVSPLPVPAWVAAVQDTMETQRSDTPLAPFAGGWDGTGKDTAATWGGKKKDTTSTWDAFEENSTSVSEKKPRYSASSTWGTIEKQHNSPRNTPPAPYTKVWDGSRKNIASVWEGSRKDIPSPRVEDSKAIPSAWVEHVKDSPTVRQKKLHSTSSSTWGTGKDSTWDTSKDFNWDAVTTWSSAPKPSHKLEWTTEPSSPAPWATTSSSKKPQNKKDRKSGHAMKSSVENTAEPKCSLIQPKQDTTKKVPVPLFTTNWSFPPPSSSPPPPLTSSAPQPPPPPRSQASHTSTRKTTVEKSPQPTTIRTTEATDYGHAVARPEYLDSLERPYAVFRFRCRRGDEKVTA